MHLRKRMFVELVWPRRDWLQVEGLFHFAPALGEALYPIPKTDIHASLKKNAQTELPALYHLSNFIAAMDSAVAAVLPVLGTSRDRIFIAKTSIPAIIQSGDALLGDKDIYTAMGIRVHRAFMDSEKASVVEKHAQAKEFLERAMLSQDVWDRFRLDIFSPDLKEITFEQLSKQLSRLALEELSNLKSELIKGETH